MNTPETVVHRLQVSHGNEMCVGDLEALHDEHA